MASYSPVPTEEPEATKAQTPMMPPPGQVFVLVPVTYESDPESVVAELATPKDNVEPELFYGLYEHEQTILSWLLCVCGYFFFFPWFCGVVCMRATSRPARIGGFTSAICLLLSLLSGVVMLVFLATHQVKQMPK